MNLGAQEIIIIIIIVAVLFGLSWAYNKRKNTGGGSAPSNKDQKSK